MNHLTPNNAKYIADMTAGVAGAVVPRLRHRLLTNPVHPFSVTC